MKGSATLVTSNLPFNEWIEAFRSERLTGALLDRLTHHVHILEMNGECYRLKIASDGALRSLPPSHPAGLRCRCAGSASAPTQALLERRDRQENGRAG